MGKRTGSRTGREGAETSQLYKNKPGVFAFKLLPKQRQRQVRRSRYLGVKKKTKTLKLFASFS